MIDRLSIQMTYTDFLVNENANRTALEINTENNTDDMDRKIVAEWITLSWLFMFVFPT